MTKCRGPSWGRNNYPENGLVNPPRRDTRALGPAGMFGGNAPPRLSVLFVWAKENSFFVMVLQFLSNFACVLITLELEHMQKGRLRNIEEHFQNRVSSRGFL